MRDYKPNTPFNVPVFLLTPTTTTIKGIDKKTFVTSEKPFYCSFKTFGGTEKEVNGLTVVENTAVIETYYDPTIKANCRIKVDELEYEILGTPENINMQNQYLKFKVRAIEGGA